MQSLIDLNFYANSEYDTITDVIFAHRQSLGYIDYAKDKVNIEVIKHLGVEGAESINGVKYTSFKTIGKFWYIPFKTLRYIRKQKPDAILTHGLLFPLQVIALRLFTGRKVKIIVQHHLEKPFKGIKKIAQQTADKCIDAYIFTSREIAKEWNDEDIIKDVSKCYEGLEASSYFSRLNKNECKSKLGLDAGVNFLWVGRLNMNKDPLTMLRGFEKYLEINPTARLYMFYHEADILQEVQSLIDGNDRLKMSVTLKGKIEHDDLCLWYSACDYYFSASHRETTSFAFVECMSCGCIPIVTDIPAFRKLTDNGKNGLLFEAGNPDSLFTILKNLNLAERQVRSDGILDYFSKELSFKAIADNLLAIIGAC